MHYLHLPESHLDHRVHTEKVLGGLQSSKVRKAEIVPARAKLDRLQRVCQIEDSDRHPPQPLPSDGGVRAVRASAVHPPPTQHERAPDHHCWQRCRRVLAAITCARPPEAGSCMEKGPIPTSPHFWRGSLQRHPCLLDPRNSRPAIPEAHRHCTGHSTASSRATRSPGSSGAASDSRRRPTVACSRRPIPRRRSLTASSRRTAQDCAALTAPWKQRTPSDGVLL
jgi:hypothetical protein